MPACSASTSHCLNCSPQNPKTPKKRKTIWELFGHDYVINSMLQSMRRLMVLWSRMSPFTGCLWRKDILQVLPVNFWATKLHSWVTLLLFGIPICLSLSYYMFIEQLLLTSHLESDSGFSVREKTTVLPLLITSPICHGPKVWSTWSRSNRIGSFWEEEKIWASISVWFI